MRDFRKGEIIILIATDISARGIDIPNVEYVVNYDIPDKPENYVHRVGRTGRGTSKGNAISFCSSEEKAFLESVESILMEPIDTIEITKTDYIHTKSSTTKNEEDWQSLMKSAQNTIKKSGKKKRR